MEFNLDHFKSVQENEAKWCFVLTMWPQATIKVTESGIK